MTHGTQSLDPFTDSDNDLSKFGPIDDILNQFWARLIAWTKLTLSRLFVGPGIGSEPKFSFPNSICIVT